MKLILLIMLCLMTNSIVNADNAKVPDIREGLWELTSVAKMSGMPMEMPPITNTSKQCLSKKDALDPRTMLKDQQCEINNMVLKENQAQWEMSCSQQNMTMIGKGMIHYQRESMTGAFDMTMKGNMGAMKIITKMTGRYMGLCQ